MSFPGCGRLSNYTDAEHVQRAKEFQGKNDIRSAVIELKNALQKNPKNAEARLVLGEIYVNQGLGTEAEKELHLASDLGINSESIKVPLGFALLQQQEYTRVLKEIEPSENSSKLNTAKILVIRGEAQIATRSPADGCKSIAQALEIDSTYIPAYHGSARCEVLRRHPDGARAELEKAIKLDEKSVRTWALLGDLERANGRLEASEFAYANGLKIKPDDLEALIGRATLRLQMNKLTEAGNDIAAAQKVAAGHPMLNHLQGVLQYRHGKYADAKTSFESTLKVRPNYLPAQLWLGLTLLALGNDEQALKELTQFTHQVPNAAGIVALQAQLQVKLGDKRAAAEALESQRGTKVDDPQSLALLGQAYMMVDKNQLGLEYLARVVEKNPNAAEGRILLASAFNKQGDQASAIKELEKAIRLDSAGGQADEMLIQALINQKKYDQALPVIDALQAKRPKDPQPLNYRGVALLLKGDSEGGKAAFNKALEIKPGYYPAAENLAQMAMSKGEFEEARKYYQSVLVGDKDSLPALMGLYLVEKKANRPEEAKKILETATAKHPKAAEPAVLSAQEYLNASNPRKALEVSENAAQANPENPGLLEIRGLAYLYSGDAGNALGSYKRLVKIFPDSADAQYYLSTAHAALKDLVATRADLAAALKLNPKHAKAKGALAQLESLQGKQQEALRLAREMQKDSPTSPEGVIIEAEVLGRQKDYRSAMNVVSEALKRFPQSDDLVFQLARIKLTTGDRDGAITEIRHWQKLHPSDSRGYQFIADMYRQLGQEKEAVAAYESILKLNPADGSAANNLAWLLRKSDPARALELAESLNKTNPNIAPYMDTLGWLLINQGAYARSIELLQKANQLAPDIPDIQYHLAVALAKSGNKALARRELERLLASGKKFSQADDARKMLSEL